MKEELVSYDEKELQLDQLNCNAKQHFHRNLVC